MNTLTRWRVLALCVSLALCPALVFAANGASDYTEQNALHALFKQTTFPVPTQLWFSLHSADPGDTCASELSATGSYARAQLNPDANSATNTNYNAIDTTAPPLSKMSNKLDITFPQATANWNSGSPINYWALRDASTGGNCLWSGTITSGVTVLNTQTLKFTGGTPGSLVATVD